MDFVREVSDYRPYEQMGESDLSKEQEGLWKVVLY